MHTGYNINGFEQNIVNQDSMLLLGGSTNQTNNNVD